MTSTLAVQIAKMAAETSTDPDKKVISLTPGTAVPMFSNTHDIELVRKGTGLSHLKMRMR